MAREHGIIERGEVREATEDGYRVASFEHPGIVTAPLRALVDGETFSVGDRVCYFSFCDGTGRIVGLL